MVETQSKAKLHLTGGRLLARNTIWNLIGYGAPMLVAVFAIPILIRTMGNDRFGVLALAWGLIGYAGLIDLGLGRALTQLVAKKLGTDDHSEIPTLVWTSLLLMLALGVVGAIVIAVISPWLVHNVLKIPPELQPESVRAFYWLGVSTPVVISATALRGLLEAHQRFDMVTALRIPTGVFTFLGPLLVLPFSHSLVPVVGILVVGRFLGCIAFLWVCLHVVPELKSRIQWHGPSVGPLLRFGSWSTVTNLLGPLMMYTDRFVIGAMVSATAVAYYVTPFEVVTKLFVIPIAISGVMFPAFSLTAAVDLQRSRRLYRKANIYVLAVVLPITAVLMLIAKPGLVLWLGADFAQHSFCVAQMLLVGTFALAMAFLPFTLIQGLGRPDIPAKLNMLEVPFYAAGLFWLIQRFGITGAALAWVGRAVADAALQFYFAHRLQRVPAAGLPHVALASPISIEPLR